MERAFEQHLAAVSRWEPHVCALTDWSAESARQRAQQAGSDPLGGWALGVKDIIDVEGLVTRCGVEFLDESSKTRSATIVSRLESLGAYVFAKTVTTVFAYFDPGPTRNPWNLEHTPGGSSMGSAAAVACGCVRAALGTQTIGSIGRPAAYCGVVGFKPSYLRMPQDGVFLFSPSVDTVGFFTRSMADMESIVTALFRDELFLQPPDDEPPKGTAQPRVGVVHDLHCDAADQEMLDAVEAAATQLAQSGWTVDRDARLDDQLREVYSNHRCIVAAEVYREHEQLFGKHRARYSPKLTELLLEGQQVSDDTLRECLQKKRLLADALDSHFDDWDILLTPGAPGAAPRGLAATGDPRMSLLSSHTGVPALTLPGGRNARGLPLGVQLLARSGTDLELLRHARAIESVIGRVGAPPKPDARC